MGNHLRRGQVRLYLVPADGSVRDDRAVVARALLDRWFPICPVLTDQAMAVSAMILRRSKAWRMTRGTSSADCPRR